MGVTNALGGLMSRLGLAAAMVAKECGWFEGPNGGALNGVMSAVSPCSRASSDLVALLIVVWLAVISETRKMGSI